MLVNLQYQSDLGSVFYYAPLKFSQRNTNGQTVQFFDYTEIIPEIILSQINDVDFSCEINKNILERTVVITATDNNIYSFVNPIRPYTEDYFTLLNQLKESSLIYTYRMLGEKIKAFYVPIILEKNA